MADSNGQNDNPAKPAQAAEPVVSKPYIMPDDPEEGSTEALAKEAADARDKMLRTLAEMENLRKRTAREVSDARTYGISGFARDVLDIADNVESAKELLSSNNYDAIFLDHDLVPEHYGSSTPDDERTGYAIALWLASNPEHQRASTILVHTRNADGAMRMVGELRTAGRAAEFVPFPMLEERIRRYWPK